MMQKLQFMKDLRIFPRKELALNLIQFFSMLLNIYIKENDFMQLTGRCDFCGKLAFLQDMEETANGNLVCSHCYAFVFWSDREDKFEEEEK